MKILLLLLPTFLYCISTGVRAQGNGVKNGNPHHLTNDLPPGLLNTGRGSENAIQKSERMNAMVPTADPFE
jgi:hypothetical protein